MAEKEYLKNDPHGSVWRKWDLHFHTPSSYDYKNKSITNEKIIEKLSENNISVVAVTDHHLIDVERINTLQKLGKEKEITVLPGIEFCAESRGKEPVHFIGIFSEASDISFIWSEINSKTNIASQKQEGKKDNEIHCKLEETCKLIKKLGGIVTIHAGDKSNTIENITHSLPVPTAEKIDIIKNIDIFELGKPEDQIGYNTKVFPSIKRVLPMIICSDNHKITDYTLKENCWIKADPTFDGLKQIIYEPTDRVLIDKEPEVCERVRNNKTKYIKSLIVNQKSNYGEEKGIWFKDISIDFNKELVAIIGNKGSGKSALSDIMGLLCDTHNAGENNSNLTFLNNNPKQRRFRQKGFAENFEAKITWEEDSTIKKSLNEDIDKTETEKAKYLPQNYFESLTNDLEGQGFERTLKSVIFLHIPEANRLGKTTFEELEKHKSTSINKDLSLLHEDIEVISSNIIELEKKNQKDYKDRIDNYLKEKQKELDEHLKNKPPTSKDPSKVEDQKVDKDKKEKLDKIGKLNESQEKLNSDIVLLQKEKSDLVLQKDDLQQIHDDVIRFESTLTDYKKENKERLTNHGLSIDEILNIEIKTKPITDKIKVKSKKISDIETKLLTEEDVKEIFEDKPENKEPIEKAQKGSLVIQIVEISKQINSLKNELSKPEKNYQEYKEKIRIWGKTKSSITGSSEDPYRTPKTLEYYKAEKNYLDNKLPTQIIDIRKNRLKKAIEIFKKKKEIAQLYEDFKFSIVNEINKDKEFRDKFKMNIDVSFKLNKNFYKNFFNYVNQGKKGTFYGIVDGEKSLKNIFDEMNLLEEKDIEKILEDIIKFLEIDQRSGLQEKERKREILDQIDQVEAFYKYVFSLEYLEPNYELKLDGKSLDELSPGEKGALLLVFYLVIDKEDIPLIIDQPEDNLDNKSVFEVLTHFIRFAKKRRQIIIVTHNPNLAVGADAEQIVYVHIDKKNKHKFSCITGSIENPVINRRIVDILEGTMPAFDKRKFKYYK
jgi:ABC-type lipoprotein export system ATPase subunit